MILITGASASGKTETAKELKALFGINKVVTHTTRPMRPGEVNGIDYHFVTKKEFLRLKADNLFVETTEYNGNYYGTSKPEIADDKVLIVETSGAKVFLGLKNPRIVIFRLLASREMRSMRMAQRGDPAPMIVERLRNDITRFADSNLIDSSIIDINTENMSIEEVATTIYLDYKKRLANIGSLRSEDTSAVI